LFEKRQQRLQRASDVESVGLLEDLVADFKGLRDVTAEETRAKELSKRPDLKQALSRQRAFDDEESRLIAELGNLETCITNEARRTDCLRTLRNLLPRLSQKAEAAEDSPDRSQARRVLRALTSGASARIQDREYLTLIEKYGLRTR
jgi:hypothetical protein